MADLSDAEPRQSALKAADQYHRFVRWSDEDQISIGDCASLYFVAASHSDTGQHFFE